MKPRYYITTLLLISFTIFILVNIINGNLKKVEDEITVFDESLEISELKKQSKVKGVLDNSVLVFGCFDKESECRSKCAFNAPPNLTKYPDSYLSPCLGLCDSEKVICDKLPKEDIKPSEPSFRPPSVQVKGTWYYAEDELEILYDGYPIGTEVTLCNELACVDVMVKGERNFEGYVNLPVIVFEEFAPLSQGVVELILYFNDEYENL